MLRVQDVNIEVQPVPVEVRCVDDVTHLLHGRLNPAGPYLAGGEHRSEGLLRLEQVLVAIPATDVDHVGLSEVGAVPVQIGDRRPMPADGGGEVLTGEAAADVTVAGVAEVGVPVQVHQSVPAPAGQHQSGADQQAAVPAKHERSPPDVEEPVEPDRQPTRMINQRVLVAQPTRARADVVDVPPGQHYPGVDRARAAEPGVKAGLTQRLRRLRTARDAARLRRSQA